MAKISLNYGTRDSIDKQTITDGAVYVATDTNELLIDLDNLRHAIGGGILWEELEGVPVYTNPSIDTANTSIDLDQSAGTYSAKVSFSNVKGAAYSAEQMNTVNTGKITINNVTTGNITAVEENADKVAITLDASSVEPTEAGIATLAIAPGFAINDETQTEEEISLELPCEKYDPTPSYIFSFSRYNSMNVTSFTATRLETNENYNLYDQYSTNSSPFTDAFMNQLPLNKWVTIEGKDLGEESSYTVNLTTYKVGKICLQRISDTKLNFWIYKEDKMSSNKVNLELSRKSTNKEFNTYTKTLGTGDAITDLDISVRFNFKVNYDPYQV